MRETSDDTTEPSSEPSTNPRGIGAFFARHRTAWLITAAAAGFALIGSGAVAVGAATSPVVTSSAQTAEVQEVAPSTSASPTPTPTATTPPPRPVPANAVPASKLRTCSVQGLTTDPRFGNMQAQALNADTGEVLFDRDAGTPNRTASVLKLLTTSAALAALGPDYRATTRVVQGSEPGTIVLVGGGDVTLTRLPTGQESIYKGAAHLDDLAARAKAAYEASNPGVPITKIVLDASYFGGDGWQPSWETSERWNGWMSIITALQVDGDRDNPVLQDSPRSTDPVARAGTAFASYFGGVPTVVGTAPAGAAELAQVQSQPVSVLVKQTLVPSDNSVAEMLGRLTAIKLGAGNTFDAIRQATPQALQAYGIDVSGIVTVDGSGLSDNNAVPPTYLTQLMLKINKREGNLGNIYDGLPVAGRSGTLSFSDRFNGGNTVARGHIFAKTGSIKTGYTLSGIVKAKDGSTLVFAIFALGKVSATARQAIDTLATGFYNCGNNLSNN